mgnify:CR=1 FL=1
MPQDSVSVKLTFKDSTFTVYSLEEYNALPDSLKGSPEQQYLVDSFYNSFTLVEPPVAVDDEDNYADDELPVPAILFFIFYLNLFQ